MARVAALRRTQEQGFGWLSPAEQLALVREELGALSALLGAERQYLFGDRPHAVDAAAFGVLDQMAAAALNPQLAALVGEHANLVSSSWRRGAGWGRARCCCLPGWLGGCGRGASGSESCCLITLPCAQVAYRDRIRAAFFGQGQEPAPSAAPASVNKAAAGGSLKKEE